MQFRKLDPFPIPDTPGEVRSFACVRNEAIRLPFMLDFHRRLGVDRFFFIDNASNDGTAEFLCRQPDCHTFHCDGNFFAENVEPPRWTNALRNVFGDGYWTLTLDADEMFVYPDYERRSLRNLCQYLDKADSTALQALVIDMYGKGAIIDASYRKGQSFVDACPYFDPELGTTLDTEGKCPPILMFSRFRERAFWHGEHRRRRPPCITQVPLVKWRKGMSFLVAQHLVSEGRLSELQAAVLHFKFLPGFYESILSSLEDNKGVKEKGLEERKSYVDTLARDPRLDLFGKHSVRYKNSRQLVALGWMKTSSAYEKFAERTAKAAPRRRKKAAARPLRARRPSASRSTRNVVA